MQIEIRLPNPNAHIETGNGHRYAVDLHNIDLSHCDLLSEQEKTDAAAAIAGAISGKTIDAHLLQPPPSALEVWEREMLRLNKVIRDDYRYWEESAAGAISQAAATRMAAQVAAAKAHRDLRPQGEA